MEYTDEEMEDSRDNAPQVSQGSTSQEQTSPEPSVVVTAGRRRGRRKVMKKKTIKDEEGYLGLCYESLDTRWILDANMPW